MLVKWLIALGLSIPPSALPLPNSAICPLLSVFCFELSALSFELYFLIPPSDFRIHT